MRIEALFVSVDKHFHDDHCAGRLPSGIGIVGAVAADLANMILDSVRTLCNAVTDSTHWKRIRLK